MVVGSMSIKTEVLVIGSGPGGYVAAVRAAKAGREVTIVEEDSLGGVCLNHGCIPTKTLIHSSNYFSTLKALEEMGIEVSEAKVNFEKMMNHKDVVVKKLSLGIKNLLKKHGVEFIQGKAVFDSEKSVRIEGKSDVTAIEFDKAILAMGSKPIEIPGFDFSEGILSSRDILKLKAVPKSLAIIGGGYIGTEMATVFGKLGSKVTIIEATDKLVGVMDPEIVKVVADKLKNFDVSVLLSESAKGFSKKGDNFIVELESSKALEVEKVLVVVGRKPNTADCNIEKANINLTEKGFVSVDDSMRTSNEHIFAVGDVGSGPMLAHNAIAQAKVVGDVLAGENAKYNHRFVPSVVFNDPELASVGFSEEEAKAKGYDIDVVKFPLAALGKAQAMKEPEGFIKLIAEKGSGLLLGFHAAGAHMSSVVGEAALALEMGATAFDIAGTIHPHPTISEGLMEAAEMLINKSVHVDR